MARRQSARGFSRFVDVRCVRVARVEGVRLAVAADGHHVRLLLPPGERPFRAVDFDEQIVLAAMRNLAGGDRAPRAVCEANDGMSVIVELPAGLEDLEIARDLGGE